MTQNDYKTSDLISPEEAEAAKLNDFFWNRRKKSQIPTPEEQARIEYRKSQREVYNKRAQAEAKRLIASQWKPKSQQPETQDD